MRRVTVRVLNWEGKWIRWRQIAFDECLPDRLHESALEAASGGFEQIRVDLPALLGEAAVSIVCHLCGYRTMLERVRGEP